MFISVVTESFPVVGGWRGPDLTAESLFWIFSINSRFHHSCRSLKKYSLTCGLWLKGKISLDDLKIWCSLFGGVCRPFGFKSAFWPKLNDFCGKEPEISIMASDFLLVVSVREAVSKEEM